MAAIVVYSDFVKLAVVRALLQSSRVAHVHDFMKSVLEILAGIS